MKTCVLLTQYKRNHLEKQLQQIKKQTLQPDYLIVFQNEEHINIDHLKQKYDFIHVKSDFNTKFFGRFSYCFNIPADIFLILDDDIIPGIRCIETYSKQCIKKNGIIGGNGRYSLINIKTSKRRHPHDNIRPGTQVDFVGHLWCFKKEWLHFMFRDSPYTYDTGEDMQLCFSSKLYGGIQSYVGEHKTKEDFADITLSKYSSDQFSSYKTTSNDLRNMVEKYWQDKGLIFIT